MKKKVPRKKKARPVVRSDSDKRLSVLEARFDEFAKRLDTAAPVVSRRDHIAVRILNGLIGKVGDDKLVGESLRLLNELILKLDETNQEEPWQKRNEPSSR